MREIKFRAWHEASKTMFKYDDISINGRNNCVIHVTEGVFETNSDINPVVLEQFTGLKDKNGKDIYEGHIVEFVGGAISSLSLNHYDKSYSIGQKLKVTLLKSGFTLQALKQNSDIPNTVGNIGNYDLWNYQSAFKIIGNIHENPELLK